MNRYRWGLSVSEQLKRGLDVDSLGAVEFDVCVIGSGPAGICFLLEYAQLNPSAKLLLVEAGLKDLHRNRLDDSINVFNPTNHHSPYECTNKEFGGTSKTWGGRCVMYDRVDFVERDVVKGGCTWNTDFYEAALPFVDRAQELFECGPGPFSLECESYVPIAEGFKRGPVSDTVVERWSMPTRFGVRYREHLSRLENVHVLEGWCAERFCSPDSGGVVTFVRLQETSGQAVCQIKAKRFVVAAGAQESTRLLLKSPQLFSGLGGQPPALGRFYQGHVSGKIASVQFWGDPKRTEFGFRRDEDGSYVRRRFQLSEDVIVAERLLNCALWLDNPMYHDPVHRNGAMSLMYLAMIVPGVGPKLAPPAVAHSITKGVRNKVWQHIWNVIVGIPRSLLVPASIFLRRYCVKRKLPGVFLFNAQNRYALHFHSEQVPLESNRMELSADGKSLNIHYEIGDEDIDSVIRSHQLLDQWLRQCECGELEYWYPIDELPRVIREMSKDGVHQCGTTRIGNTCRDGVVDANLRVFGTSNVYVCSTSVLPTSSQANPTFFLGVLAVRLAHGLASS